MAFVTFKMIMHRILILLYGLTDMAHIFTIVVFLIGVCHIVWVDCEVVLSILSGSPALLAVAVVSARAVVVLLESRFLGAARSVIILGPRRLCPRCRIDIDRTEFLAAFPAP
jgi:hypothetical protein